MAVAAFAESDVRLFCEREHPGVPLIQLFEGGDFGQRPHRRLEDLGFDVVRKFNKTRGYLYPFQAADLVAGEVRTTRTGIEDSDDRRIGRYPLRRIAERPIADVELIKASDLLEFCELNPTLCPPRPSSP